MGKAPAFQFYIKDWLSDPQLKMASFSTKGIWIDMLCYMWGAPERGIVQGTKVEISRLTGANDAELTAFLKEAKRLSFCDISVTDNEIITICNRRMFREETDRKNNRLRQAKFREKRTCNKNITPPSPTASPTASKKHTSKDVFYMTYKKRKLNGKRLKAFNLFWDTFSHKSGKAEAADSWLDIPELTDSLVSQIIQAAEREAIQRPELIAKGRTPKMAQGWISGRRWEDEKHATTTTKSKTLTAEDLKKLNE